MIRKLNPEKRERFLTSALKLFVSNGVQNTSTAAIAQEAGTAAGTLFLYFPTKQDLIDELVLNIGRTQSETIKSKLNPALSARETFITIWDCSVRWFLENKEAYKYIQQVRDSTLIGEVVVQESTKFFDFYYEAIQKGLKENSIKPYPIELIGEILYRDIVAVMNLISAQFNSEKQEEYIQFGFEIFWNGIKKD
jgi:AcrR family transcriptional regulator